jgi:hypothetical protein
MGIFAAWSHYAVHTSGQRMANESSMDTKEMNDTIVKNGQRPKDICLSVVFDTRSS